MQPGDGVDVVANLEESVKSLGAFSHVECMSVLEHTPRPWLLAANIERMLVDGGTLFVTVPFVFRVHGYPSDYYRFSPEGVRALFPAIEWRVIEFAHVRLSHKLASVVIDAHRFFARTEVCGFGTKRCAS